MQAKIIFRTILVLFASALASTPLLADETLTQTKEERIATDGVDSVLFLNLAGEVTLGRASGDEMTVKVTLSATGDDEDEAREYLGLLDVSVERDGDRVRVTGIYPVEDYSRFAYRREGGGWGYNTTTRYLDERVQVSSRSGLAVHMDFDVAVPDGVRVRFENKVGGITATGVNGDLDLDTSSGSIDVRGGEGYTVADTGSGAVDIRERKGEVRADTGSGSVEVSDVEGDVHADTGSGGIELARIVGNIVADTGSGGVDLEDIKGDIVVDTGSGSVDGVRLADVRSLEVDTGSGSVELDGDFSALERMRIDTGSGGVRIRTEGTLNMHLEVSAGSGGVNVDLPEMKNVQSRRGDFEADIGDGEGDGVIDTGSGGVRISNR
ncbi:MAG: hypothetical protein R3270_04760 [Gammaproteobacteria bacterium]|nr:hypothetical protein [Gammaproteobacteria bacterium]